MRVLLVAKPWRGGLADYVFAELKKGYEHATWISTQPSGMAEKIAYKSNKQDWRLHMVDKINRFPCDLAIFINHYEDYKSLEFNQRNVIWLIDDPGVALDGLDGFAHIYLSDPGYQSLFADERFHGRFKGILPFAASPEIHQFTQYGTNRSGICFLANRDSKRDGYLQFLLDRSLPIQIYGNYFGRTKLFWRHPGAFRPSVHFANMRAIYQRFSASLNVHAAVVKGGTNMRTFECAAFGIPQFVENMPGLAELFTPDEELLLFENPEELVHLYKALADSGKLAQLAHRAYERVMQEHTYSHRINRILAEL